MIKKSVCARIVSIELNTLGVSAVSDRDEMST
jgi:hypothetical protein